MNLFKTYLLVYHFSMYIFWFSLELECYSYINQTFALFAKESPTFFSCAAIQNQFWFSLNWNSCNNLPLTFFINWIQPTGLIATTKHKRWRHNMARPLTIHSPHFQVWRSNQICFHQSTNYAVDNVLLVGLIKVVVFPFLFFYMLFDSFRNHTWKTCNTNDITEYDVASVEDLKRQNIVNRNYDAIIWNRFTRECSGCNCYVVYTSQ